MSTPRFYVEQDVRAVTVTRDGLGVEVIFSHADMRTLRVRWVFNDFAVAASVHAKLEQWRDEGRVGTLVSRTVDEHEEVLLLDERELLNRWGEPGPMPEGKAA